MRSNRKILFGLSLILGAFLFFRAFQLLSGMSSSSKPVTAQGGNSSLQTVSAKVPTGHIAQAAVDIPANSIVTPEMLRLVPYDGPSTKGFVTDIEAQGAGFITRRDIPAGSQLRPDLDFVGHVSETGIAGLLQPGRRAMIVPIANKPTLHDLVRIGNFVDVLAAFDGQESRTLVENVRVLGVDVSANDYPNVNAAMRGPFKAAPKSNLSSGDPGAGASTPGTVSAPSPAPGGAAPGPAPTATPVPANVPRPDPALILEVTPRQAASIQLALASNAPLDFLVRPALPANRSIDPTPLDGTGGQGGVFPAANGTNPGNGIATTQTVSVTKAQIAPYAEARKAAGAGKGGGGAGNRTTGGSRSGSGTGTGTGDSGDNAPRIPRGGRRPLEAVPGFPFPNSNVNTPSSPMGVPPIPNDQSLGGPSPRPVPAPMQTYTIPVYGDGKILRTETVPLPAQ
jgi:Flp pilus assembly protein CpaB